MRYSEFCGEQLSSLGLGMMRLPCTDDKSLCVDEAQVKKMIDHAIENGINYFDTAWIYHGGNSEAAAGKLLTRHPRSKYCIATKYPAMLPEVLNNARGVFETQLQRCNCQFFDFYLLHNVNENTIEYYLDEEKYHIVSYFAEQKKRGLIRHLGFSCHCSVETLKRFLERYGDLMEFGQVQLNYLDWHLQDGERKVALLSEYGIPVWVMEPLRGGKLVDPPADIKAELEKIRPGMNSLETAFRFLQSIPQVKVVLSGMGNLQQLEENIRIFSEGEVLTEQERNQVVAIADRMTGSIGVPCTGCRYCVDKCPAKLDIPLLLAQYNEHKVSGGSWIARMVINKLAENQRPGACISCGNCTGTCPQQIPVPEILHKFAAELEK